MAKRIQMRKQRFMAIQKIAEQKKLQAEGNQTTPGPGSVSGGVGARPDMRNDPGDAHSHHGHSHSHGHPHKQQMGMSNRPSGMNMQPGSRGCSLVGPLFQEVRFKVHDPKAHSKGGTLENTINGGRGPQGPPPPPPEAPDAEAPPTHLIHPGKVSILHISILHLQLLNHNFVDESLTFLLLFSRISTNY